MMRRIGLSSHGVNSGSNAIPRSECDSGRLFFVDVLAGLLDRFLSAFGSLPERTKVAWLVTRTETDPFEFQGCEVREFRGGCIFGGIKVALQAYVNARA